MNENPTPTTPVSPLIDMDAVVEAVKARGHTAYVEQTGGGCATIYAGPNFPDRFGDMRWAAAAGPGEFRKPGWKKPVGSRDDFYIGPEDDGGRIKPIVPAPTATAEEIADLIVGVIEKSVARADRFREAAKVARDAMWQAFAEQYPEVTSGDVAALPIVVFEQECDKVLLGWLDDNQPDGGVAATRLEADNVVWEGIEAGADELVEHIDAAGISAADLSDLLYHVTRDNADDVYVSRDFSLIGDDAARAALRDRADDVARRANSAGVQEQAHVLVYLLGADKARERINDVAAGTA